MFVDIADDHGGRYQLEALSSGESNPGHKRERWDLRAKLRPAPPADVEWLRLRTPDGPITAILVPPPGTEVSADPILPVRTELEVYLADQLHDHIWLHLLDPERPLGPISVLSSALVAVDAIDAQHPLVAAIANADAAIGGGEMTGLPPALASALAGDRQVTPWIGGAAVGVAVDHPDGARIGLEALVGHPDRIALHFIEPETDGGTSAWGLLVTATDDHGRGHVGHAEALSSMTEGAFHLRPPLAADATNLTLHLEGPSAVVHITIKLSRPSYPRSPWLNL
jgi:hypothetical protein